MKKTLLIAAAALAASVISSQAQVYSQNIVGYVNQPLPLGYLAIANPVDASDASGQNNTLTNIIPVFSGNYDGSQVYFYNGHSFTVYTVDSGRATGFGNQADSGVSPVGDLNPPALPPGQTIFFNNATGLPLTNTFVGSVHVDKALSGTQTVGTATNYIPTGKATFVSSKLPIGGRLHTDLQLDVLSGVLDGAQVQIPNIVGGAVHGYTTYTLDSSRTTGFGNQSDSGVSPVGDLPEPSVPVGYGFFINNTTGTDYYWVQTL